MGLFTFNYNKIYLNTIPGQSEPAHRPPENKGNKQTYIEVLIGVAVSYYADPYLNGVKAMLAQSLEVLSVSPGYASTASELLCFTVICTAPALIIRTLTKLLK
ncbi:hypothetical protein SB719_16585 [Pantoea sp. SIMBA_079]|uniref:hypothetical protein n=1 Tax=Pantoea sp. SIMBA_079 TaxID=3085817 RepID=UPI003991E65E